MPDIRTWIDGVRAATAGKWRVIVLAACGTVAIAVAAVGYGQWHYVQHDNRFCTTCHVPHGLERFAGSAHERLECRACHRTPIDRQLHLVYASAVGLRSGVGSHAA